MGVGAAGGGRGRWSRWAQGHGRALPRVLPLVDLSCLSVSSVAPLFSIAAAGGVLLGAVGPWVWLAVLVVAVPFLLTSFIFRLLNQHFPHAGASYHWARRILGYRAARLQAWVLVLAYFTSLPPILLPAARYTWALLAPGRTPGPPSLLLAAGAWAAVAFLALWGGSRPTARLTQAFMALELTAVGVLLGLALARWPALHVPVLAQPLPWRHLAVAAVIGSTIVDGWEIDSYAAEEAHRPRHDPGLGGIVGAAAAVLLYLLLFPLLLHEVPLPALAGSPDPLAPWAARLLPGLPAAVLLPVLASTAGSLWLTTYILARILLAMGRDDLAPPALARLSPRGSPALASAAILAGALAVMALQLLLPATAGPFALALSAAGFFLTAEFFLDSLSAAVFLSRAHRGLPTDHDHPVLRWAAVGNAVLLGLLLVAFLAFAPAPGVIGTGIDRMVLGLVAAGGLFAWWGGGQGRGYHCFDPEAPAGGAEPSGAEG